MKHAFSCRSRSISLLSLLLALAHPGAVLAEFRQPTLDVAVPRTAEALIEVFDEHAYALGPVRESGIAPRIYAHSIPLDMASIADVREKKSLFIRMLLPLVLKANEEILAQRERLVALQADGESGAEDRAWLAKLASDYGSSPGDTAELLVRVNAIPPALALAQGIDESGWGTSHFARADEALFGQHAPQGGAKTDTAGSNAVAVAAFETLLESVRSYSLNLNSGHAYHALRQRRAEIDAAGRTPSGAELAEALLHYSERGSDYVAELRSIIHSNALHDFDAARLASTGGSVVILPAP